jgi:hypothetical protein
MPGRRTADLWSLIGELVADGTTVLLTTQYLEEADRLATHIVVIDSGRIIAEGTPVELKARLGSIVVEIRVVDPADARRAAARLQRIAPAGVLGSGDTLAVKVPDKGPATMLLVISSFTVAFTGNHSSWACLLSPAHARRAAGRPGERPGCPGRRSPPGSRAWRRSGPQHPGACGGERGCGGVIGGGLADGLGGDEQPQVDRRDEGPDELGRVGAGR